MRRINREGQAPGCIRAYWKLFKKMFFDGAGMDESAKDRAELWEYDNPDDVVSKVRGNTLLHENPDTLLQVIHDKKTDSYFIAGVFLWDRETIGNIDFNTGEVTPPEEEEGSMVVYAPCTIPWAKALQERVIAAREEMILQEHARRQGVLRRTPGGVYVKP